MRSSRALARIKAGDFVRIAGLGHYMPPYLRHAAHFGFDCVWLDLEHRAMDSREVQALLAFSHLFDIDIMVRPPTLEKSQLYRYFEDGAAGLMIPLVANREQAEEMVRAVKFPPIGDRGIDAAGLDADFTLHTDDDYTARANAETFLVIQIETVEAVENVEEIAATPGVDALLVGIADLRLRLKYHSGKMTYEDAVQRVATAARECGKAWGHPGTSAESVQTLREMGAQLIPYAGEFLGNLRALEQSKASLDELLGPRG